MEKNMNNEQQADASVQKPVAVIPQPAASAAQTGVVNLIEIGDFGKIDLRVAKVISAQKVEKADKLLLLCGGFFRFN